MSTLKADTIVAADGNSPVTLTKQAGIKAFSTPTSSATPSTLSLNFASGTDHGTGDYSYSLTNAFTNTGYTQMQSCFATSVGSVATRNSARDGAGVIAVETSEGTTQSDKTQQIYVEGDLA